MNKKKKIIIASIISIFVLLISFIGVFAYYEYYGQYASILNIDGTIKLDAFDVLYPTLKDDKDGNNNKTYGCTPENPYVIDNVTRLRNLIRLNNSGKLEKSKEKYNVDKYYFCLQFDAQEVPQILNLLNEGEFSSLGNNEYPFVDELSGIVYGVEYSTGYIAYYSGCLPIYKVKDGKVFVNGIETNLDPANYSSLIEGQEYICTNSKYDGTKTTAQTICFDNTWEEQFILVSSTTIIHQVIANETIVATDNQVDIGFVSNIGDGGYIHDLVLYNETITAKEEGLFESFMLDLSSLFSGHPRKKTDTLEERHIGLFAGHMSSGANAKNISLAGNNTINIDTERVNYFSNYTTVGYIEDDALIGGKLFSIIATDSMLDGNIQGVLFADEIYLAELKETNSGATTDYDGATHYKLVDKTANGGWPGTEGTEFKYGSFTFLLSNSNDTVSSIWSNSSSLTLLGEAGYKINGSVLYCADEYRYQANNGINQSSASVKESSYNGITKLENSGNVIDQGKYIIVAKVDNNYYSLKIAATEDSSGNVTYYFDTTDKINVTDFLTTTGTLYQSSLWEVETPSATPKLKNCRFEDEYFKGSTSSNALNATNNLTSVSLATEFSFNLSDSKMYFTDSGSRYYLNFNSDENKFYFSEDANTDIEIYKISDGYNLNAIKQYSEITDLASYLIVVTDGTNNYLVGLEHDTTTQTITTDLQATAASNISSLASGITDSTVTMTVSEYEEYKNFIWRANKNGNNTVSFIDVMSSSLYLSRNGADIIASSTELNWTYGTQNNTTILSSLSNGDYYLTYNNGIATTTQNYRVYLLEITPQDDTPPYITYDGAKYLDATASTIETGTYAVVATAENGEQYVIGVNNGSISTTNRFIQTTTYNSLYTYYTRSGSGSTIDPYVYTVENISGEYVAITLNNTTQFDNAKTLYGGLYAATDSYSASFTISNNTTYYIFNGYFGNETGQNGYGYLENTTDYAYRSPGNTFDSGNTYYTSSNNGSNGTMTEAFTIDQDTVYYSNQNGTIASSFTRGNTYYTKTTSYASTANYINGTTTYYYKSLNYDGPYYIDYLFTQGFEKYEWDVRGGDSNSSTAFALLFSNVNSPAYYLDGTSVSTDSNYLYYDSINQQVYYLDNDSSRNYIYYNSSNGINSVSSMPLTTNTSLYKVEKKYVYSAFNEINCRSQEIWNHSDYYYFVSSKDLFDTNSASYLIGAQDYSSITTSSSNRTELSIGWQSMQNNYSYNSTTKAFSTTQDISKYTWKSAGVNTFNNSTNYKLYGIYNEAFESYSNKKSGYHLFLGVSSSTTSRTVSLIYTNQILGYSSNAPTGFVTYSETRDTQTEKGGYFIGFRAGGWPYYFNFGNTNPSAVAIRTSNSVAFRPMNYVGLYYYYAKAKDTTFVLSLVSSAGDTLEENIHYAIATKTSDDKYYAMTYDGDNSSDGLYGTDMTTQIDLIIDCGNAGYRNPTTIPSNCDWEQVSNNFELRFMHYNSSSTTNMNYMDQTQSNGIISLNSSTAYTVAQSYFYDTVNKILYYNVGGQNYYMIYNESTNKFGVTTDKSQASDIYLIRYTPSYKVERVTTINSQMQSGEYIIAGYSVDGYFTMGIANSTLVKNYNITNYLTSNLSEDDYNNILNYIWVQNDSSSISSNATSVNMLLSNLETQNGIAAYRSGSNKDVFEAFSSSSNYTMTLNSSGLWSMFFADAALANGTGRYISFTTSNASSSLKVVSTVEAIGNYISDVNTVTTAEAGAIQVAIYSTSDLSTAVTALSTGNYIIFVKVGAYWYMLYLNGTNVGSVQIGKNLNDLSNKITNAGVNNYIVTSTAGPSNYGYYLTYNSSYYLYCNGTSLSVTTSQQNGVTDQTMHWKYSYNSTYQNQSYLYTVYQATVNNYLGASGSKVTTDGTATYLYTVTYNSGTNKYSLGSIATGVTAGNNYALVIFNSGYYYLVARESANSTNITYTSYGSGLPTTLSEYEVFSGASVTSGYSFTQIVNGSTHYLIIDTDKTLILSTNSGSCYFTYSGNTGSGATFTGNSTSEQFKIYLFRVSKNDELDNSTDVTVTLSGHIQASASLSVIQSDNYIIVAESSGVYYAMSFTDNETIVPIDVTKTMEEALDGANIRLYSASVFEQLGSEYSLIFNSNAFNGSFYYLLDGTYSDRNDNSPIVDPVSLYESGETYYTLNVTTYTGSLDQAQIEDGDYFYFVSGYYIKETTYNPSKVYYTITETLFTGSSFEEGVSYYKKKTTTGYEEAYEFKDNVNFYTRSGEEGSYTYTLQNGLTSFDSLTTYYVLATDPTYIEVNSKTTGVSAQNDDYIWTIYTFSDSGNSGYVIGWYSSERDNTSYLYFNSTNNQFELTTDITTAYQANSLVQIYRLGEEITTSETFKTFNVYLEQDGVTILSFPLNEIKDVDDIETYNSTTANQVEQENGTTMDVIPGEYLIATKENDHYYALTLDSSYELSYADITLVFDGNLIKDENGYYCVSINTKYLWNQVVAKNSLTINDSTISGLQFENVGYSSQKISYESVYSLQFELLDETTGSGRISLEYNSTRYYLSFTEGSGYSFVTGLANACDIYIYSVGATAKADSNDSVLSYTYYSTNLDQINYSYFEFNKYLMEELPNYTNVFGGYEYTTGWYLSSNNLLTEVNSSVYFVSSASYNTADFVECSYDYDYDNGTTITPLTLSYYAPKGTASFAITDSDVSEDDAVYLSVIVSTELSDYQNADIARYLSLWKVGTFTESTGVANDLSTAANYATALQGMFKTPTMAIPLANHYDTTTGNTSKSLVKVSGENKYLSTYGYDHLIAHTFKITEPGIYYLGTTSGTVAFSYLSIDKMKDVDEGADSSQNISEDFTIDYAWGTIGNSSNFSQINTTAQSATLDNAIGSVAYIGRTGSEDTTWVHSNIYPEVINGTPGVWTPDTSTTYYTIEAEEVEAHIQTFNDEATYYIKSGSNYVAAGSITSFAATTSYYVYDVDKYVLVHIGSNDSFYYIAQADESLYFKKATSNTRASKFYLLSETSHTSLSSFSLHTSYFVSEDNDYKLVYNPTDYLDMEVLRTYAAGVSTVNIDYSTYDNIYFYGYGVMYLNVNKASNRDTRTVNTNYTEKQD